MGRCLPSFGLTRCILMSDKSERFGSGWINDVCGGATIVEGCLSERFGGLGTWKGSSLLSSLSEGFSSGGGVLVVALVCVVFVGVFLECTVDVVCLLICEVSEYWSSASCWSFFGLCHWWCRSHGGKRYLIYWVSVDMCSWWHRCHLDFVIGGVLWWCYCDVLDNVCVFMYLLARVRLLK